MTSNSSRRPLVVVLAACALAQQERASAQSFILSTNSDADVVVLLDAFDGSILDPAFIADDPTETAYDLETPKDAFQVGNEIWVLDQVSDQVIRFDLQGNHLATIFPAVGMVDNIRGGCFANGTVYVTSDGTNNGAPGNSVVMFDPAGNRLGSWPAGDSPFDVLDFNGTLLVSDFGTPDRVRQYDYAGNFLDDFVDSNGVTGPDAIQQIARSSTGSVWVNSFSSPQGIFEFDVSGAELNYYAIPRLMAGVIELGNGLLLNTGGGLWTYDRSNGLSTQLATASFHYLNLIDTGAAFPASCFGDGGDQLGCTACPCGNDAPLGSSGGCTNSNATSARLVASGTADVTTPADTLHFDVFGANVTTFGILASGSVTLPSNPANPCFTQNPGSGVQSALLDGLRCVGGTFLRHGSRSSDANGDIGITTNGWGPPNNPLAGIGVTNGFVAGQTRFFQVFYRENPAFVCLTGQATTNAVSVTFQ